MGLGKSINLLLELQIWRELEETQIFMNFFQISDCRVGEGEDYNDL